MNLENVELRINGELIGVTNLEVTFDTIDSRTNVSVEGVMLDSEIKKDYHWWGGVDIAAKGTDQGAWVHHFNGKWEDSKEETKKEDSNMRDRCEEETTCSDNGSYSGERLAQKIKELDLTDGQRKLRKYNLVDSVGLITAKGKDVLLNHLLSAYAEEIVEDLESLEEAERLKDEA